MGELRQRGKVWWIRYYRNGKRHEESSGSKRKKVATDLLKVQEGKIAEGVPMTARIGQLRFEEAAADVVNDYRVNGKRSIAELQRRIDKHLSPFFGGRRMTSITTSDARAFVAHRQSETTVEKRGYDLRRKDGTTIRVPRRPAQPTAYRTPRSTGS